MRISVTAVGFGLALVALTPAPAAGQSPATPYSLAADSRFARGCFGPCACPVLESKLAGTFQLREQAPDPLNRNFAVEEVKWVASEAAHPLSITGSGTYTIGGEVAAMERMVLDLSIDGGPTERYDSGNVPGGGDFPRITIPVRLHPQACMDTVLTIDAVPDVVGIDPRALNPPRLSPNPFVGRTDLGFGLRQQAAVDVTILDLGGRRVRHLVQGEVLGPGFLTRTWDGKTDEGVPARSGFYRVRIQADGQTSEVGVVKLR